MANYRSRIICVSRWGNATNVMVAKVHRTSERTDRTQTAYYTNVSAERVKELNYIVDQCAAVLTSNKITDEYMMVTKSFGDQHILRGQLMSRDAFLYDVLPIFAAQPDKVTV